MPGPTQDPTELGGESHPLFKEQRSSSLPGETGDRLAILPREGQNAPRVNEGVIVATRSEKQTAQ